MEVGVRLVWLVSELAFFWEFGVFYRRFGVVCFVVDVFLRVLEIIKIFFIFCFFLEV